MVKLCNIAPKTLLATPYTNTSFLHLNPLVLYVKEDLLESRCATTFLRFGSVSAHALLSGQQSKMEDILLKVAAVLYTVVLEQFGGLCARAHVFVSEVKLLIVVS